MTVHTDWLLESVPERVLTAALTAREASFLFDVESFARTVASMVAAFEEYAYPIKANPHPALVQAAYCEGASLDCCSPEDVRVAQNAGATDDRITYTAAFLDPSVAQLLGPRRSRADLGNESDVDTWQRFSDRPVGLRLCVSDSSEYSSKFGFTPTEATELLKRRPDIKVDGIHFHDAHGNLTPAAALARLEEPLSQLPASVKRDLRYLNVGGGWNIGTLETDKCGIEDYVIAAAALKSQMEALGFSGRLVVEPGDWVAVDHGWWVARVAVVRRRHGTNTVAILDTNTPMPSRGIPTPFALVRDGRILVQDGPCAPCEMYGSANNQRDLLGSHILMPQPRIGDVVVFSRCGAYVRSLIGSFNERRVPPAVLL